MYTGALENEPALVDALSQGRELWGNPGRVLREIRSPIGVADALRDAGLDVPRASLDMQDVPPHATWLSKPLASCGGTGIYEVNGPPSGADDAAGNQDRYFQQRIGGVPCGAVFVAAGGRASLLGISRQLVGTNWSGATGFQYAGSIAPLRLPELCVTQLRRAGDCLASRFGLQGLFGIDAIVADQSVWPVEVNPRYTASVELIERVRGIHAIGSHVKACCQGRLPPSCPVATANSFYRGKAVVYATDDVITTYRLTYCAVAANVDDWPQYADIPDPGTEIRSGHPILTVFAEGGNGQCVEQRLRERVETVRRWLS
jgi:predicted ATP-grasp superfamily ATP-dependent carboligase